tara:strand:+ start:748 stop:957 length:210 start_codon:yes stop_codon:yes gene_type:complete
MAQGIETDKEGFEIRYSKDLKEWARISPCCKADVSCYGEGGACCRKCFAPLDEIYLVHPKNKYEQHEHN